MTTEQLTTELSGGYATCELITNYAEGDVHALLEYQTVLMGLLPRSAMMFASAELLLNKRKGDIAELVGDFANFVELSPTKMKFLLEGKAATEISLFRQAERLNRTVTHLLDALNVKIPNEHKLFPQQSFQRKN